MPKTLRLPVALAVLVLSGCDDGNPPETDASMADAAVADAGCDAGGCCEAFEQWDPTTMQCVPLV